MKKRKEELEEITWTATWVKRVSGFQGLGCVVFTLNCLAVRVRVLGFAV